MNKAKLAEINEENDEIAFWHSVYRLARLHGGDAFTINQEADGPPRTFTNIVVPAEHIIRFSAIILKIVPGWMMEREREIIETRERLRNAKPKPYVKPKLYTRDVSPEFEKWWAEYGQHHYRRATKKEMLNTKNKIPQKKSVRKRVKIEKLPIKDSFDKNY